MRAKSWKIDCIDCSVFMGHPVLFIILTKNETNSEFESYIIAPSLGNAFFDKNEFPGFIIISNFPSMFTCLIQYIILHSTSYTCTSIYSFFSLIQSSLFYSFIFTNLFVYSVISRSFKPSLLFYSFIRFIHLLHSDKNICVSKYQYHFEKANI